MRTPIIAGNWKLNKAPAEAAQLARDLRRKLADVEGVDVVLAPPFVSLSAVRERIATGWIKLAAQNLHWEDWGAYTGEISGPMLRAVGCDYVIIGHSERRQFFGETDETVNKRIKAALSHDLTPIVCVGESLDEREAGKTNQRVEIQLAGALAGLSEPEARKLILAYEPIWAIGTGRTASTEQAQEVHAFIRQVLSDRYSADTAATIRIQYGGSVKPSNVEGLMSQPDIDGALVGGASLSADTFAELVIKGGKASR